MTKVKPRNHVRFIWFSAEESGLIGLESLRRPALEEELGRHRGDAELRHGRVAELRPLRL